MFIYPNKAITTKTLDKFTYNMYIDIYINRLKYNNDSSTTLRLLSSIVDTSQDVLEDLGYKPRFNMKEMDFVTIDRFNGFYLNKIPNIEVVEYLDEISTDSIYGYSRFTNKDYLLKEVKNNTDFARHSLPCDSFLSAYTNIQSHQTINLTPNVEIPTDIQVEDSLITIKPVSGLNSNNLTANTITLTIKGIGITGKEKTEEITLDSFIEYKSSIQYSFITSLKVIGTTSSVTVVLYPYINGCYESWDNDIIDRETFEIFKTYMTLDTGNKKLVFNIVRDNKTQFPVPNEPYKTVDLGIVDNINSYFIDAPNKLLYTVSSDSRLSCFPLIIPNRYNNTLDTLKTKYQSINVEYYDDCINREYSFYVFPNATSNDVETMSIYINGEEYESDLLLDLFRENIDTNKFVLPYNTLFRDSDEAIIEFKTYGLDECICPIYVHNTELLPLYTVDLKETKVFKSVSATGGLQPYITTRKTGYNQPDNWDFNVDSFYLFKLSSRSNIIINGYEIINIFDTFNFDEASYTLITSDTITGLNILPIITEIVSDIDDSLILGDFTFGE